ncbi:MULTISPECIES: ATP-binding cassette domain-containing protein [unclassified Stenotrophomonas]|jgi:molybdate transport system ATP-binding protein|uniref:ATP-binding cassette domain-containing protein n=1 Tax=unclassified Stenotrophomonas TaxID=196198 RepID=UPI00177F434C|nr:MULTISPECIES: ATP-binding cassette domain-containing protein [unclassified Stenotrophomonas]MBD8643252.1 ATP-binding cassette domain-containing protein [Stenotrophomonas sp. CFBP 13724]MDY1034122.1 ATP-binding cassette domain-containing protein [Stenotrophomonas sp. CFBP8980]
MWLDADIQRHLHASGEHFRLQVHLQCTQRRVVLFGPSGAGKSLTLKAIAGLLTPDAGRIVLDGQVLFDSDAGICVPARARRLGYVFQDYALFPHLTVRQNVAFGVQRGWWNARRGSRHAEVEHWLRVLRIDRLGELLPSQVSGGQRQRVALARALVTRPRALLLDEPFAALDHDLRAHLRIELQAVLDQAGMPLLLISHDPEDVAVFGEQVLHLLDGRAAVPDERVQCRHAEPPAS